MNLRIHPDFKTQCRRYQRPNKKDWCPPIFFLKNAKCLCQNFRWLFPSPLAASRNLPDQSGTSRMRWMSTGCGLTDVAQISRASPITRRQVQYTSISVKSATKCPIGTLSSSLPVLLSVCLTHNIYCYSGSFWFSSRNGIGLKKKLYPNEWFS